MIVKDLEGRERPQRVLWVYKDNTVKEEACYGSADPESPTKDYWYVLGVGSCRIGIDVFETREEALAYGRRQLEHEISLRQGYLKDLV